MRSRLLLILGLIAIAACSKVKYGEKNSTPVAPRVQCDVDWLNIPDIEGVTPPTTFNLYGTRVYNNKHYWRDNLDAVSPDTLKLEDAGEYLWLMYADGDSCIVENRKAFQDSTISIRDLSARVPSWSMESMRNHFQKEIREFTIKQSDIEPVLESYFDTLSVTPNIFCASLTETLPARSEEVISLHFSPKVLSRNVTFMVNLILADEDEVNFAIASILGVPKRVGLVSGLIDGRKTSLCQVPFCLKEETSLPGWYRGDVRVLGILPPNSRSEKIGAGILEIVLDLGETHRKVKKAFNLYEALMKRPLLTNTEYEDWYEGSSKSAVIQLVADFSEAGTEVDSGTSDPVNDWEDHDGEASDISDEEDD